MSSMNVEEAGKLLAIRHAHEGRIVHIDLNRPDEGNAMTRDMTLALIALLGKFGADDQVNAIVIEGRGDFFCRGRDAKGESRDGMSAYAVRESVHAVILGAYSAITACPVPVICCVNGRAIGFGAALSMACDVTLASDVARFSFPEINNLVPPALAMSALLRKVPPKAVSYLIYSGEEIDAGEALTFGMVSKLIPSVSYDREVADFLAAVAKRPRLVLQTIKRYERHAQTLPAEQASEYAGTLLALAQTEIKKK